MQWVSTKNLNQTRLKIKKKTVTLKLQYRNIIALFKLRSVTQW
jgi:hypothetical protein